MVRHVIALLLMGLTAGSVYAEAGVATAEQMAAQAQREAEYYRLVDVLTGVSPSASRDKQWKPGDELALEISGMDLLPDGRLAVAVRKGDVYFLDGVYDEPAPKLTAKRFATALHEPMGLLVRDDGIYTAQRTELTRLRDVDGDERADEYLAIANQWDPAGNYHEYVYGPAEDGEGNLWVTLNLGMGDRADNTLPWHGWAMRLKGGDPWGVLEPMCSGMRSPSGIGANAAGDLFYTDQQGTWVPTGTLHHLRRGVFFGNPEAKQTMQRDDAPVRLPDKLPVGKKFPEAIEQVDALVPPAVWFPYHKVGESATDIALIDAGGRFGPFDGQLLVGEFRSAGVSRVYLEKVSGQYQGACFNFRTGLASGVFRLCFGKDGSLFAGLTNRGWTSAGHASYGLQRLVWTGKTPFEIQRISARPDGFKVVFTRPVDAKTAGDVESYIASSYTYIFQGKYGGPEVDTQPLKITNATVSDDRRSVHLKIANLRQYYVHELRMPGVRDTDGNPLLHPAGYYTLNAIPESK